MLLLFWGGKLVVGEGVVVRNCVVLPNKGINSDVSNEVISPFNVFIRD